MAGAFSQLPVVGDVLAVTGAIKSSLPHLEDEAVVTVHGSPKANRKQLYFLAAATAFSLVKRYDILAALTPPPGLIMIEWDGASNTVRFTVRYRTCLTTSGLVTPWTELKKIPIYGGPPEEIVGGAWSFIGAGLGIPVDPATAGDMIEVPALGAGVAGWRPAKKAPSLPFAGRPILTRKDVCSNPNPAGGAETVFAPNPRPSGDNRSRGTAYTLVYQALTTPQGQGLKTYPAPPDGAGAFTGG